MLNDVREVLNSELEHARFMLGRKPKQKPLHGPNASNDVVMAWAAWLIFGDAKRWNRIRARAEMKLPHK